MQCITVGSVPLCCQGTSYINGGGAVEEEVDQEAVFDSQCPANSFAVVDENSKPIFCNTFNCRKKQQFCYDEAGVSICCETNFEAFDDKDINKESRNALTNLLIGSEKFVEHAKIMTTTKQATYVSADFDKSTSAAVATTVENTEETSVTTVTALPETFVPEQKSSMASVANDGSSKIKYEPHEFGGYILSKSPSSTVDDLSRENSRQFAKRFLLEQIKRGWPYNEDFYTPFDLLNEN